MAKRSKKTSLELRRADLAYMIRQMLSLEDDGEIPLELARRINRVDSFLAKADRIDGGRQFGELRSRQVVATIIEQWEREGD